MQLKSLPTCAVYSQPLQTTDQDRHLVGPDLDTNLLKMLVFLKNFLKKLFLTKTESVDHIPVLQRIITLILTVISWKMSILQFQC